jgi:hypothetical protein
VTVQELMPRWQWKPTQHCPERFVLVTDEPTLSLDMLVGDPCKVPTFHRDAAEDPRFCFWRTAA